MKFHRAFRVTPYEPTSRKRAAVVKRQRLDRDKFPLFADEIAEGQDDPDQVLADRAVSWVERQRQRRSHLAREWIEARARLSALPDDERAAFIRFWNRSKFPKDAGYLKTVLHCYARGDYVLHDGEVRSAHEIEWERSKKAWIAAMSEAELDRLIQTHISPLFVGWGRVERQRRAEAAAIEAPAPRPPRRAGRK
jgi:hypothetical protein